MQRDAAFSLVVIEDVLFVRPAVAALEYSRYYVDRHWLVAF
jgi:hypothetical protein